MHERVQNTRVAVLVTVTVCWQHLRVGSHLGIYTTSQNRALLWPLGVNSTCTGLLACCQVSSRCIWFNSVETMLAVCH
jgi:hypothetical protein